MTSEETLVEAARENVEQAKLRMAALVNFPLLPASTEAAELAEQFLLTGALPPAAKADALHLAGATLAEVDYLLTWTAGTRQTRKSCGALNEKRCNRDGRYQRFALHWN
jgi:hypothetical protein